MEKITKKSLVGDIQNILNQLNVKNGECYTINLNDIVWVSHDEIMKQKKSNYFNCMQNYRLKLYSKDVDVLTLKDIRDYLKSHINN